MNNIYELLLTAFKEKDKSRLGPLVKAEIDLVTELIEENKNEDEIPELYKFNSGFDVMLKIYKESRKERDYHKCLYVLNTWKENYDLKF